MLEVTLHVVENQKGYIHGVGLKCVRVVLLGLGLRLWSLLKE